MFAAHIPQSLRPQTRKGAGGEEEERPRPEPVPGPPGAEVVLQVQEDEHLLRHERPRPVAGPGAGGQLARDLQEQLRDDPLSSQAA